MSVEEQLAAALVQVEQLNARILLLDGAGLEAEHLIKVKDRKTPKVSTPDTFDGSRDKLQMFLVQISTYMTFNEDLFKKEEEKVLYAASYLRGSAAAWFQPYSLEYMTKEEAAQTEQTRIAFASYNNFIRVITQTFGAINEIQDAERNIMQLRQLASASAYTTKFMQYRAHLTWDESALCAQYYNGLKDHLKIELARMERPTEISKLIDIAVNLDDRMYDAKRHSRGEPARNLPPQQNNRYPAY